MKWIFLADRDETFLRGLSRYLYRELPKEIGIRTISEETVLADLLSRQEPGSWFFLGDCFYSVVCRLDQKICCSILTEESQMYSEDIDQIFKYQPLSRLKEEIETRMNQIHSGSFAGNIMVISSCGDEYGAALAWSIARKQSEDLNTFLVETDLFSPLCFAEPEDQVSSAGNLSEWLYEYKTDFDHSIISYEHVKNSFLSCVYPCLCPEDDWMLRSECIYRIFDTKRDQNDLQEQESSVVLHVTVPSILSKETLMAADLIVFLKSLSLFSENQEKIWMKTVSDITGGFDVSRKWISLEREDTESLERFFENIEKEYHTVWRRRAWNLLECLKKNS